MSTQGNTKHTHNLTRISVAHILKSIGFRSSKSSALETLTRITTLFLHHLSSSAAASSAVSRRSSLSSSDVLSSLRQLPFFFPPSLLPDPASAPPFPPLTSHIHNYDSNDNDNHNDDEDDRSNGESRGRRWRRGPEVPEWLPEFPECRVDDENDSDRGNGEVYWEEEWRRMRREEGCVTVSAEEAKEGGEKEKGERKRKRRGEVMMKGRRERVKFRLGGSQRAKSGNVDGLELRNGVCRGGKRICLVSRVDSWFFDDDDDKLVSSSL